MKRINILFLSFFCTWLHVAAQESKQMQEPADSVKNRVYIDTGQPLNNLYIVLTFFSFSLKNL